MIGRVVGKYRLIAPIGEGGMGVVYRAEHEVLGSPAAVKVLLPQYTRDAASLERFFGEARTTSAIRNPGIVEVFDFGRSGDDTYIAMELLRGENLQTFLERNGKLSPELAVHIGKQIYAALDAVHVHGVVHRDLKPDNIFLVRDKSAPGSIRVKILDFGIAKLVDAQARLGGAAAARPKTKQHTILGTPTYMAPEQCKNLPIDARADLYGAGCILFQMLTGRPPFVAATNAELLAMHIYEPPPRLTALVPRLPVELDALLAKLLIKDPADRIPSAGFALAELERAPIDGLYIEIPLVDGLRASDGTPVPRATSLPPEQLGWKLPLIVILVALAVAGAAIYWIGFRDAGPARLRGGALEDRVRILPA